MRPVDDRDLFTGFQSEVRDVPFRGDPESRGFNLHIDGLIVHIDPIRHHIRPATPTTVINGAIRWNEICVPTLLTHPTDDDSTGFWEDDCAVITVLWEWREWNLG